MVGSLLDDLVRRAARALALTGTGYAIVGGMAMLLSGRDRSTRDLDIIVNLAPGQLEAVRASLREAGFSHMDRADRHFLDGVTLYRFWLAAGTTGMSVSLDLQEGKTEFHQVVLERARTARYGETDLKVATPEDLILLKLLAGRPIDLADAREMLHVHGEELDQTYLAHWSETLGLPPVT